MVSCSREESTALLQEKKKAVEARMRGDHSAEVAALQGELDQSRRMVAEVNGQLLAARCDLEELEASARGVHRSLQLAQSEADGLRGELAEALQTKAGLEGSLRHAEAEVAAREEELHSCQERLEQRSAEVRGVKSLLSSALQPRIPCKPLPRLISLDTAAAAKPSSRAAAMERLRVPRGRCGGGAQRPATADASLLGAGQPSGFAVPKPVWRQSSVAAAVERRLRPVSSSGEDELETDAAACLGDAKGGTEPVPPAGARGRGRDGAVAPEPCSSSRRVGNGNKGAEEGFGFAPTPSAGSITAGGCAPTRRCARPRVRTEETSCTQQMHRPVPGEGPHPIIERVVIESLGPPAAEVLMERTHPSPQRRRLHVPHL
ncbi:hypothetical protein COCOBI_13-0170 [Coccomyxa sp. Obi]|nr:hypothetical protein COCOBI_13-0170 [Coccomyxa sp. Obi]